LPNTRAQLPGDPRPAQPITTEKTTWRDAWLEATVQTEINALGAKRRRSILKKKVRRGVHHVKTVYDPQTSYAMYGVDITCPPGVTLTPLSEMQPTINITIPVVFDDVDAQLEENEAIAQITAIITEEYRTGGLCRTEDGRIMATPSCTAFPGI